MKNYHAIFIGLALVLLVFTGSSCTKKQTTSSTTSPKSSMTEHSARAIGENMCIKSGETLSEKGTYNENSKTWWFDANLNPPKEGCNPACVVDETTKMAEINWRCTGLVEPTATATTESSDYKKLCDWVDKSEIIIKVNFANGVTKDTSYEAGFYFGNNLNARLARKECNYRTGFSFSEMKGKGAAQMGVRGYTDNVRRALTGDPISVTFDANGKPSIGTYIEVTVEN